MNVYKRLFSLILASVIMAGSAVTAFALPPAPTDENGNLLPYTPLQTIEITPAKGEWKYEDYFVEYLNSQYDNETFDYYYEEVYSEYSSSGSSATPDYVLVECYKDYIGAEGDYTTTLGNYTIKRYYKHYPYNLGYFVFIPESEQILTLEEAVSAEISGIYQAVEKIAYKPVDAICSFCGLTSLDIPGGGTMTPPEITLLGSEKEAEIYEFIASSNEGDKVTRTVGDWKITGKTQDELPYNYGIFVYHKAKVYTLDEALEKGIVNDIHCVNKSRFTRVENKALSEKCKNHYLNHLNYIPTEKDTVYCKALGKIRNHIVFSAHVETDGEAYPCIVAEQIIGDYIFRAAYPVGPNDNPIGLYVLTDNNNVISALQAYRTGLISDEELITVAYGEPYDKYNPYGTYEFNEIIVPKLQAMVPGNEVEITSYTELYKHYSDVNPATPDYVLFYIPSPMAYAMPVAHIVGDYFFEDSMGGIPLTYGYGIYIPETDKIHDIVNAYDLDLKDVDNIFRYTSYAQRIGDNNNDNELNIKDATYLQKCLAGLEEFREDDELTNYFFDSENKVYISDYNRDGMRNIRDATAIQKKLANITP